MDKIEFGKDEVHSARRRLVRGAFGVPAVLALQCGSAQAASSFLVCVKNQNTDPKTLPTVWVHDGLYLRYQLYAFVDKAYSPPRIREEDGFWINGAELNDLNRNGQLHWLGGNWQRFRVRANELAPWSQSFPPKCTAEMPWKYELRKVNRYVALRVDGNGRIVGAGATGGGSAVGASCWNSFAIGSKLA